MTIHQITKLKVFKYVQINQYSIPNYSEVFVGFLFSMTVFFFSVKKVDYALPVSTSGQCKNGYPQLLVFPFCKLLREMSHLQGPCFCYLNCLYNSSLDYQDVKMINLKIILIRKHKQTNKVPTSKSQSQGAKITQLSRAKTAEGPKSGLQFFSESASHLARPLLR